MALKRNTLRGIYWVITWMIMLVLIYAFLTGVTDLNDKTPEYPYWVSVIIMVVSLAAMCGLVVIHKRRSDTGSKPSSSQDDEI
jgi:uncharacterized membrane protein